MKSPRTGMIPAVGALIAGLALAGLVDAADAPVAQGAVTSAGDATRGRQLFHDHGCYGCHGFNGNTGARDLVGTNSPLIADLATFTTFLRLRGDQAPLLPSTRMPNYPASALSDAQVRDIYAYVRTFKVDAPAVKDVPTLKAILESASRPKAR
ncbi:MAG: cytochrome c [Steroidobacteraceae bacterium]